jgi:hypothetical protein
LSTIRPHRFTGWLADIGLNLLAIIAILLRMASRLESAGTRQVTRVEKTAR